MIDGLEKVRIKMTQASDSEILCAVAMHPLRDILKLLSQVDCIDPYRLCKELGIPIRDCYSHLKVLDKFHLIGGQLKYHLTEVGREMLIGGLIH